MWYSTKVESLINAGLLRPFFFFSETFLFKNISVRMNRLARMIFKASVVILYFYSVWNWCDVNMIVLT